MSRYACIFEHGTWIALSLLLFRKIPQTEMEREGKKGEGEGEGKEEALAWKLTHVLLAHNSLALLGVGVLVEGLAKDLWEAQDIQGK